MSETAPALTPSLLRTDHALGMFITDLARGIYPGGEIATRWGFADEDQLKKWLLRHPKVVDKIREQKTLNEADDSVLDRIETKFSHLLDQGSGTMAALVTDPGVAASDKIKIMELAAKLSGAAAKTAPKQGQVAGGAQFNVVFQFANAPSTTISTTVVDAEPAQVISQEGE